MNLFDTNKTIGIRSDCGIGDCLMSMPIVEAIHDLGKKFYFIYGGTEGEYHRKKTEQFQRAIVKYAPFPVIHIDKFREWFSPDSIEYVLKTNDLRQHEPIVYAMARALLGETGIDVIKSISPIPKYYGERYEVDPFRIGIGWETRQRKKWRGMQGLMDILKSRYGNNVGILPQFENRNDVVRWIQECKIFVASEGGMVHLCAALSVPCICIIGGRISTKSLPYPLTTFVTSGVCRSAPCSVWSTFETPCMKDRSHRTIPCMKSIQPADVAKEVFRRVC